MMQLPTEGVSGHGSPGSGGVTTEGHQHIRDMSDQNLEVMEESPRGNQ